MQPEILHRCSACGAAIREVGERVMFCPECGKALTPSQKNQADSDVRPVQKKVADDQGASASAATTLTEGAKSVPADREKEPSAAIDGTRHSARERTREKLQRASSVARGAIEDNVKRVEKIHHVSTVMFEEAHYDPSLRFVLVAVGIFVLFIILLVLSKVMG